VHSNIVGDYVVLHDIGRQPRIEETDATAIVTRDATLDDILLDGNVARVLRIAYRDNVWVGAQYLCSNINAPALVDSSVPEDPVVGDPATIAGAVMAYASAVLLSVVATNIVVVNDVAVTAPKETNTCRI